MTELIEASNNHQTRRHFTTSMRPYWKGRMGMALCSTEGRPVEVFDQQYHDQSSKDYGYPQVDNSSLPLCKRCERKAAKEGLEVPK